MHLVDKKQKIGDFIDLINQIRSISGQNEGEIAETLKKSKGFIREAKSKGQVSGEVAADTYNILVLYKTILQLQDRLKGGNQETVTDSKYAGNESAVISTILNLTESNKTLTLTNREQWLRINSSESVPASLVESLISEVSRRSIQQGDFLDNNEDQKQKGSKQKGSLVKKGS